MRHNRTDMYKMIKRVFSRYNLCRDVDVNIDHNLRSLIIINSQPAVVKYIYKYILRQQLTYT